MRKMLGRRWLPLLALAAPLLLETAEAATLDCHPGWSRSGNSGCRPDNERPPPPPPTTSTSEAPPKSYDGSMPSIRSNAIWNTVSATGRVLSPTAGAGASQRGGALAYDVFTVPQSAGDLDLVARLGLAGGYSAQGNRLFDLILGLGAGYTVGNLTMMALCWMVWDGDTGADAPALQVPSGLAVGPELHAQLWLVRSLSLDLSAARVFRFTGDLDDPAMNVGKETRLSAALGLGENTGASIGASFIDYQIGRAVTASLAIRWGARN